MLITLQNIELKAKKIIESQKKNVTFQQMFLIKNISID